LLLRPPAEVALTVAGLGVGGWALRALYATGTVFFSVFMAGYAVVAVVRVVRRDPEDEAVIRALVEHADPGEGRRRRAAAVARVAVRPRASDRWGPIVLGIGLAAGCILAAFVRGSWWSVLPVPFLLGWCAALLAAQRTSRTRAGRWLDDPPGPVDDQA
jgi:hypothetical protein